MRCPSCNAENPGATDVCFKCGRALSAVIEGAILNGRYKIVAPLGRGGMGAVYKARDLDLDEIVALKLLRADLANDPVYTKRFRSEIKLARRVSHPNVCRIHEFGRDGPLSYIVMECVEGVDLRQLVREKGRLPPAEALDIAVQITDALQVIHAEGILHRDLKTPNIMLNSRRVAKLMDFGIARSLDPGVTGATVTGQILGTPEYMSPEQARGEALDARSDIYALGIVIFELFTGDVPFRGDTPMATLFKHIQDPPPLEEARGLPQPVVPILRKALAKPRQDRFQNAAELATALRAARAQLFPEPVQAPTPAAGPATRPAVEREPETRPQPVTSPPARSAERAAAVKTALLPTPPALSRPTRPSAAPALAHARPSARDPTAAPPRPSSNRRWLSLAVGGGALVVIALAIGVVQIYRSSRTTDTGQSTDVPVSDPSAVATATATVTPAPVSGALKPETTAPTPARPTPAPLAHAAPTPRRSVAPAPPTPTAMPVRPAATDGRRAALESRIAIASPPPAVPPSPTPERRAETPTPQVPAPIPKPVSSRAEEASPVAPVSAAQNGMLRIVVNPWAQVEVDRVVVGIFPPVRPLPLAPGAHTVTLKHTDYQPFTRKVTIRPGETTRLEVDLTKEAFPK